MDRKGGLTFSATLLHFSLYWKYKWSSNFIFWLINGPESACNVWFYNMNMYQVMPNIRSLIWILMGFNFHPGGRVWHTGCVHAAIPEAFDAERPIGLSGRRDKSSVWKNRSAIQTSSFTRRTQVIHATFLTQEEIKGCDRWSIVTRTNRASRQNFIYQITFTFRIWWLNFLCVNKYNFTLIQEMVILVRDGLLIHVKYTWNTCIYNFTSNFHWLNG